MNRKPKADTYIPPMPKRKLKNLFLSLKIMVEEFI